MIPGREKEGTVTSGIPNTTPDRVTLRRFKLTVVDNKRGRIKKLAQIYFPAGSFKPIKI